jgi:hypothetical protein
VLHHGSASNVLAVRLDIGLFHSKWSLVLQRLAASFVDTLCLPLSWCVSVPSSSAAAALPLVTSLCPAAAVVSVPRGSARRTWKWAATAGSTPRLREDEEGTASSVGGRWSTSREAAAGADGRVPLGLFAVLLTVRTKRRANDQHSSRSHAATCFCAHLSLLSPSGALRPSSPPSSLLVRQCGAVTSAGAESRRTRRKEHTCMQHTSNTHTHLEPDVAPVHRMAPPPSIATL